MQCVNRLTGLFSISRPDLSLCECPVLCFLAGFFLSKATPLLQFTRYHSRIFHKSHPSGENLDSAYYRGIISWLFRLGFHCLGGNPVSCWGNLFWKAHPSGHQPPSQLSTSNPEIAKHKSRTGAPKVESKLQAFL